MTTHVHLVPSAPLINVGLEVAEEPYSHLPSLISALDAKGCPRQFRRHSYVRLGVYTAPQEVYTAPQKNMREPVQWLVLEQVR